MKVTQKEMDVIATYMDDDLREQICSELAPCEPGEFLTRYCELVPEFGNLLKDEFLVELKNGEAFKTNAENDELTPEEEAAIERYREIKKAAKCGGFENTFCANYARIPDGLKEKLSPEELGQLVDAFWECYGDGKNSK